MKRLAVAWVAAIALSTATAVAQMSPPPHAHATFVPHPVHSRRPMPPIVRRSPRPTHTGNPRLGRRNGSPYQPYVVIPPSYAQSALSSPYPGPTPKPKPTATSMYEVFSTLKNRR
jgi:hypothetical protein